MPAQTKPESFELRGNSLFFWTQRGCVSCLHVCLGARLLPQFYQYPNLSEGTKHVSGQLRGDKECPFSGVTKSGRVWRKVLESDARSVHWPQEATLAGSTGALKERTCCRTTKFISTIKLDVCGQSWNTKKEGCSDETKKTRSHMLPTTKFINTIKLDVGRQSWNISEEEGCSDETKSVF